MILRKLSRTDYYGVTIAVFKMYCFFLPFNVCFSFALLTIHTFKKLLADKLLGYRGENFID